MSDSLTTITNLVNSPPGQLVAGGVLAGIVWKFFERVEAVLTDDTKLEIATWLVGAKAGEQIGPLARSWPSAFLTMFDRLFSSRPVSWKCFWRSCLATYGCIVLSFIVAAFYPPSRSRMVAGLSSVLPQEVRDLSVFALVVFLAIVFMISLLFIAVLNGVPNYIALLKTRYAIQAFVRFTRPMQRVLILTADVTGSLIVALGLFFAIATMSWLTAHQGGRGLPDGFQLDLSPYIRGQVRGLVKGDMPIQLLLNCYPIFFGITWFSFYAGSGFLLRAARRFDVGFQWFNRRFDIEKKPLQSIGLVAGAFTALVYWGAVILSRII